MTNELTGGEFKGMAGAHAAMFTPFDAKSRVNEEAIDQIIEYGIQDGFKGFCLTDSRGEGMLLTNGERKLVYRRAVRQARRSRPRESANRWKNRAARHILIRTVTKQKKGNSR